MICACAHVKGRVVVMADVGDLYYIKQHFRQNGVEALMAGYWRIDVITGASSTTDDNLAQAVHEQYDGEIHGEIGSNESDYYKTVVEKTESIFFGEYANPTLGGDSGDKMPDFNSISVKQNVGTRLTRSGFKRIPFIVEARSNGNNPVLTLAQRAQIENFYGGSQTWVSSAAPGVSITGHWEIVKRVESPAGSGNYVPDFTQTQPVVTASVGRITTQNSRKS